MDHAYPNILKYRMNIIKNNPQAVRRDGFSHPGWESADYTQKDVKIADDLNPSYIKPGETMIQSGFITCVAAILKKVDSEGNILGLVAAHFVAPGGDWPGDGDPCTDQIQSPVSIMSCKLSSDGRKRLEKFENLIPGNWLLQSSTSSNITFTVRYWPMLNGRVYTVSLNLGNWLTGLLEA